MDFEAVLGDASFREEPRAYHITATNERTEIPVQRSQNSEMWYTSYDNLEVDSRIRLVWSLK